MATPRGSHDHVCSTPTSSSLYQSLDELDFERGIWYAAQYGDVEKVEKLLKQGTNVNSLDSSGYTALHYAARNGHLRVCQLLLQYRVGIDATTRSGHATALHRACSAGKLNIVELLLENKANGYVKDCDGKTALHRSVENGSADICRIIVAAYPELTMHADSKGKVPANYTSNPDLISLVSHK